MKQEILNRIKELGGNIDQVKGKSLEKDLGVINFGTVLYYNHTEKKRSGANPR